MPEEAVEAFEKHQATRSSIGTQKLMNTMVREVVRSKLFHAYKFVSDDDLHYTATIAKFVMKETQQKSEVCKQSWKKTKDVVRKAIDSKRSTTAMAVKREVISKCGGQGVMGCQ